MFDNFISYVKYTRYILKQIYVCDAAVVPGLSGHHYCAWQQVPPSRLNVCHSSCFLPDLWDDGRSGTHRHYKKIYIVKEKNKLSKKKKNPPPAAGLLQWTIIILFFR